jgi:hypothetical protein
VIRPSFGALLGLALLSACVEEQDPEACMAPALFESPADTVLRFSVDGRGVAFSSGDLFGLELDTLDDRLFLVAIRNESPGAERAIQLIITGFSGVGGYHLDGQSGEFPIAAARYWCPVAAGGTRMYLATGEAGDSLRVTSFDTATGLVEAEFRFHAERWREEGENVTVAQGHFRGQVARVGDEGSRDVAGFGP